MADPANGAEAALDGLLALPFPHGLDAIKKVFENLADEDAATFATILRKALRPYVEEATQGALALVETMERLELQAWSKGRRNLPVWRMVKEINVPIGAVLAILVKAGAFRRLALDSLLREFEGALNRRRARGEAVRARKRAASTLVKALPAASALHRHIASEMSAAMVKAERASMLAHYVDVFRTEGQKLPARGSDSPATQISVCLQDLLEKHGCSQRRAARVTGDLLTGLGLIATSRRQATADDLINIVRHRRSRQRRKPGT